MPAWEIVVIVVVVVAVVLIAAFVAIFVMRMGVAGPGPGPSRPVVTFSTTEATADGFRFVVAGVSQTRPAANYRVNFIVGTTAGTAAGLAASCTISGNTYTVAWTDVGGEGSLTAGDIFAVSRAGGLPTATRFTFDLLWQDGTLIQSNAYDSP